MTVVLGIQVVNVYIRRTTSRVRELLHRASDLCRGAVDFITLVGAIALLDLPIGQYPRIAPPTVRVQTNYLGANEVVEESVSTPIEQQVNGAESMLYMSSLRSNDAQTTLTVTFEIERDQDIASVDVRNREMVP
ncbi:MAG: efflux RND transporter permease subunit [Gammaproteobacteria bacterium]